MNKIIIFLFLIILLIGIRFIKGGRDINSQKFNTHDQVFDNEVVTGEIDSLTIDNLRKTDFSGSEIAIEESLTPGSNYKRYLASYISGGNKIYALLTIPNGDIPDSGWPVVIFNHGYIPPRQYRTTERYIAYTDAFSRNGYIVFRSDYRGHGNSEGEAVGGYGSNAYTIDVLNGLASVKKLKDPEKNDTSIVDPNRIGMWGHSMGGFITLRSMVVNKDIKAGVIWAGVVASYQDLLNNWRRGSRTPAPSPSGQRRWRQLLTEKYGTPESNPEFWNSISANSYLVDISGPIQLHHGTADSSVPIEFSEKLAQDLQDIGKYVEIYTYSGDDHNISNNFSLAINRSVKFFDKYVKGEGR